MLFCDFQAKARKCVPNLKFDSDRKSDLYGYGETATGMYVDGKYIGGCSLQYIPEFTIVEEDTQRIRLRGWKEVIQALVVSGYTTPEKVKKQFGYSPERRRPVITLPKRTVPREAKI